MRCERGVSMDLKSLADKIQERLLDLGFTVHRYDAYSTSSVYLKVDCGLCHSIRIGDHRGKKHLKYRYNIGPWIRRFRSDHDPYQRWYFTVDEVDRMVRFIEYDRGSRMIELGGKHRYDEEVERMRERGSKMRRGFWTKCREVTGDEQA